MPITEPQSDTDAFTNIPITNHAYLTISEADGYLALAHAKAYPIEVKPATKVNSDGTYDSGMYKVGVDMPAGEYILEQNPNLSFGSYIITSDSVYYPESSIDTSSSVLSYDLVEVSASKNITLEEGQYINVVGCTIIPVEN